MSTLSYARRAGLALRLAVAVSILAGGLGWLVQALPAQAPGNQPPAADPSAKKKASAKKPAAKSKAAEWEAAAAKQFPPLQVEASQKKLKIDISNILRERILDSDRQQRLEQFYTTYAFPRWTLPAEYSRIPDYRRELAGELRTGKSGAAYNRLLDLTLEFMKKAIGPEFHPVVRYNAMLVIGELNTQEAAAGERIALVPFPPAQDALLAAFQDKDQIDLVKVAALIGLIRHCQLGFADQQRRGEVIQMLSDLARSPVAPGRSKKGHAWMRTLAIEALAALRYPGSNGAVALTLADLVRQDDAEQAPPMVRMAAAKGLGVLDYQAAAGLKLGSLAAALGKMASDVYTTERDRPPPQSLTDAPSMGEGMGMRMGMGMGMGMGIGSSAPMGMGMGMGMGPGGMMPSADGMLGAGLPGRGDPYPERTRQFRQRLRTQWNAVRIGLGNPDPKRASALSAAAAGTSDEKIVRDLAAALQEALKILDDKDSSFEALKKKLDPAVEGLNAALAEALGGVAPAPAATPADPGKAPAPPAPAPPAKGAPAAPAKGPAAKQ